MDKLEKLRQARAHIAQGGGEKRIQAQHSKGKLTARERLDILFDENSFVEIDAFVKHRCTNFDMAGKDLPGDGVVTGYGQIEGRLVFAFAQDFTVSGVAHFMGKNDEETLLAVRELLSYMPSNNMETAPVYACDDDINRMIPELNEIIPDNPNKAYNMYDVIYKIADDGRIYDVMPHYAKNIITCFIRMDGATVGVIANQPNFGAGCLDINASDKAARFIRRCDAFNIPLLTIEDVPGFLPGTDQEYGGIIRHGAKMLYAYCEATVPKITLILRKAYGGAYIGMCNKELGADMVMAWPSAQIAVMGASGAVNIISSVKREIRNADDPAQVRAEKIAEYEETFNNPYVAASLGYVDDIIEPASTRQRVISALDMLSTKRESLPAKKHGNIPL